MINDLISRLSPTRVMVVGDVMVDRYWWGTVDRISPEAPVPIVSVEDVTLIAGGAANVAANINGLGSHAQIVGLTGDDAEAELLKAALETSGMPNAQLHRIVGRKTTVKNRVVAHNQQMLRFDRETVEELSSHDVSRIAPQISSAIGECDVVVFSDYGKGFLTRQLLDKLIRLAREKGKYILVDPKGKDYAKYSGASVITPNQREAEEACGLPLCDDTVDAAGNTLLEDLNLEGVVITRGERGMRVYEKNGSSVDLPASARMVYNVTGAGDTVIACLAVGLASGLKLADAARVANFAAGLVVESLGTTSIDLNTLRERASHFAGLPG